jgi:hypothetical protein
MAFWANNEVVERKNSAAHLSAIRWKSPQRKRESKGRGEARQDSSASTLLHELSCIRQQEELSPARWQRSSAWPNCFPSRLQRSLAWPKRSLADLERSYTRQERSSAWPNCFLSRLERSLARPKRSCTDFNSYLSRYNSFAIE